MSEIKKVLANCEQHLTADEQAQARSNIGILAMGGSPKVYQAFSRSISTFSQRVSAGNSFTYTSIVLDTPILLPAKSTVAIHIYGNAVWGKAGTDVSLGYWWGPQFMLTNNSDWVIKPAPISVCIPYRTDVIGCDLAGWFVGQLGNTDYDLTNGINFMQGGVMSLSSGGVTVYACGNTYVDVMVWES